MFAISTKQIDLWQEYAKVKYLRVFKCRNGTARLNCKFADFYIS